MADFDTMALLTAAVAESRLHTQPEIAAAVRDNAEWVQHYGDVGQSIDDGPWHFHRIAADQIDPLVEAAYRLPSLADADPDSVRSPIGDVVAEVADGTLAASIAWQSFVDRLTDAIRDYEIRLGIAGLSLEHDAPLSIGPVTFTQANSDDVAVATVTRHGCPEMAIARAEVVIELACDLLRVLATDAEASLPPLDEGAIRSNELLPPRYRLGVGERDGQRPQADGVNGMSDPTGRDLPISEVWPYDGRLGDWTPEHRSVTVPAGWPAAKSRNERLLQTVPLLWEQGDSSGEVDRALLSLHWLGRSMEARLAGDALAFGVISIEALDGPTEKVEGRFNLIAERVASLVGTERHERHALRKDARELFDGRHRILHGRDPVTRWADATATRDLALRAIGRFMDLGFFRRSEADLDRWFALERGKWLA